MIVIQLAFKSFQYVIDIREAFFYQNLARFLGAFTTSANEHHGGGVFFVMAKPSQHELTYLGGKVFVDCPIWFVDPGQVNGAFGVAYKQEFH